MIHANELRIGNLLRCFDIESEVWCVDSVARIDKEIYTKDEIEGNAPANQKYEGLPITEKWLVGFGFVLNQRSLIWSVKSGFNLEKKGKYYQYAYESVKIKYVHQLQNLYFALNGTELPGSGARLGGE